MWEYALHLGPSEDDPWPNQPTAGSYKYPERRFGKKTPALKSFQPDWFQQFPWLHYDKAGDRAFCYYCIRALKEYSERLTNIAWKPDDLLKHGVTHWPTACKDFQDHEYSQTHKLLCSLVLSVSLADPMLDEPSSTQMATSTETTTNSTETDSSSSSTTYDQALNNAENSQSSSDGRTLTNSDLDASSLSTDDSDLDNNADNCSPAIQIIPTHIRTDSDLDSNDDSSSSDQTLTSSTLEPQNGLYSLQNITSPQEVLDTDGSCSSPKADDGDGSNNISGFPQANSNIAGNTSSQMAPSTEGTTDTICIDHILGKCQACPDHHCSLPYQWQYHGITWTNFGNKVNATIEKAYCNAHLDGINVSEIGMIDFLSMTLSMAFSVSANKMDVRRLSTKPSVTFPKGHPLGTEWLWYHKHNGIWLEYKNEGQVDTESRRIEENYQQFKECGEPQVVVARKDDLLNFITMTRINSALTEFSDIIRRPKLITSKDLKKRLLAKGVTSSHPIRIGATPGSPIIISDQSQPCKQSSQSSGGPLNPIMVDQTTPMRGEALNPITIDQNTSTKSGGPLNPIKVTQGAPSSDTPSAQGKRKSDGSTSDGSGGGSESSDGVPFLWLYQLDTGAWWSFGEEANLQIEAAYCNVCMDGVNVSGIGDINFASMKLLGLNGQTSVAGNVRRLTSIPSDNYPQDTWIWSWQDEFGLWSTYGETISRVRSNINSDEIEEKYQNYKERFGPSTIDFNTYNNVYILDFESMLQKNTSLHHPTKRPVRRRPKLVANKKQKLASSLVTDSIVYPDTWDLSLSSSSDGTDYQLVELPAFSSEILGVMTLVNYTLSVTRVLSVKRIQNQELWGDYYRKRAFMEKKNGGGPVAEKQLFHGTRGEIWEAICRHNFDWRVSNSGCAYGKGSYFARDAVYSNTYARKNGRSFSQRGYFMFVAQVLVGSYQVGHAGILKPPPKDPSKPYENLYDSCVNNLLDPSIFVIFDSRQVYPQYLIEYE